MQDEIQASSRDDFDCETYLKMLITIARADKDNGPPEYAYIRKQAIGMGVDYDKILRETIEPYKFRPQKVTRRTALQVLRDAIVIASMDSHFSLPEKQNVYIYAEQLGIPRTDVNELQAIVDETRELEKRWNRLVAGHP